MKRSACLILCAAVLLAASALPAKAAPGSDPIIRIGLSVGSGAMAAAHLENHAGGGYEFGFLNAEDDFIPLGVTSERKLTVTKNRNVYLSGGVYSETPGDQVVGAFHDDMGSFPSRDEAEAAVAACRASGVPAFVSYASGVWAVRSGSYPDSAGGTRISGSKYCVSVVRTGSTDIIFQFDYGQTYCLCIRPLETDGEKAVTWHNKLRYYGMFEFRRFEGNDIYVYNAVGLQDYVKGVVPYEMSPTWPLEALKAQAVCARTYTISNLGQHKSSGGYNLCTTEHCQVYKGTAHSGPLSDQAVDETYGEIVTYEGNPCNTVYHSSDGGATEDSENVWNLAVPYLRGVPDPYEDSSNIPSYNWQYTCTNEQLSSLLTQRGIAHNGVGGFYVSKYTGMGNVYSVTFTDSGGNTITTFSKESARVLMNSTANGISTRSLRYTILSGEAVLTTIDAFGLPSSRHDLTGLYAIDGDGNTVPVEAPQGAIYIISSDGLYGIPTQSSDSNGVYTVIGRGHGHNVGMSQWGANGMAQQGFGYRDILRHYYTGVDIGILN